MEGPRGPPAGLVLGAWQCPRERLGGWLQSTARDQEESLVRAGPLTPRSCPLSARVLGLPAFSHLSLGTPDSRDHMLLSRCHKHKGSGFMMQRGSRGGTALNSQLSSGQRGPHAQPTAQCDLGRRPGARAPGGQPLPPPQALSPAGSRSQLVTIFSLFLFNLIILAWYLHMGMFLSILKSAPFKNTTVRLFVHHCL